MIWLTVRDALVMVGIGTAIALPGTWALRRLVEAQLFGVGAIDVPTIVGASILLALVALGAAMLSIPTPSLIEVAGLARRVRESDRIAAGGVKAMGTGNSLFSLTGP